MNRMLNYKRRWALPGLLFATLGATVLVACSSGDGPALPVDCAALAGTTVAASEIGLPTSGATITSATVVSATASGNLNGEYCKVVGKITAAATDPAGTPDINFQLNLPANWNGKTLQMGGGGYNGTVVTGTGYVSFATYPFAPPPLGQGYATFGSDSGHTGNSTDATFALNEGAIVNFGHAHIKKTHDAAFSIIKKRYGTAPKKSYWAGGSTGGREGMTAIQRYPQDYDGVIANAPAINFSGVRLQGVKVGQADYATGGFINTAKQLLILKVVTDTCDADDGTADGIVSDVAACKTKAAAIVAKLRCPDGTDQGDTCLSDKQLATVNAIANDLVLPYTLAYGVNRHEGYNILAGADFSLTATSTLGLGSSSVLASNQKPVYPGNGYLFFQGDLYLSYFIAKDANFVSFTFDVNNPGSYQQRLVDMSGVVGAMNPDIEAFRSRGGKLIVMHGLADQVISPNPAIAYYNAQVTKIGQAAVDSFWRFYTVPGLGHGYGVFNPAWDALGALDNWVTNGVAPDNVVGFDQNTATYGRTRPLCRYPSFPKYSGSGSNLVYSNFSCVKPG